MRVRSAARPWPTPSDLVDAPELATLAVIRDTLSILGSVFVSAHPELLDVDPDDEVTYRNLPRAALAADRVLSLAIAMNDAVDDYRIIVAPTSSAPPSDDEIPF